MATPGKRGAAPTAEGAWEVWVEAALVSSCLKTILPRSFDFPEVIPCAPYQSAFHGKCHQFGLGFAP